MQKGDLPLKVAINAQRNPNSGVGGVESVLIGLISALGKLDDGNEEYTIIGPSQDSEWLKPYMSPNQRLVRGPKTQKDERPFENVPPLLRPQARKVHKWLYDFINLPFNGGQVPLSNGFYENLNCDVIHFPDQRFTLCSLPSIYNPHDLQHLHFPQFFNPSSIQWRETIYQAGCHYAQVVVAGSQWIKDDLIAQYRLNPAKIQVIPWGPPTEAIQEPDRDFLVSVTKKYNLPPIFIFYPAMFWQHKNHLRLLDAIAYLRDNRDTIINLVCTGDLRFPHWSKIKEHIEELNLQSQVFVLGMVSSLELRALYRLAQFVVVPSLYEAASGPVFEAWYEGIPVTCSNVTSLPEQVGEAALLFDPYSTEAIADAILRLSVDSNLRDLLIKNGKQRLTDFSWKLTAKAYRAVYRRAAGRVLSEEDKDLLNWDWMRFPRNKGK